MKKDNTKQKREREKRSISLMIGIYCHKRHGTKRGLCESCRALNDYATQRFDHCPFMENKTFCSSCPVQCYDPQMRAQIRSVMHFAGPRMIFRHPIMSVLHLTENKRGRGGHPRDGAK